MSELLKNADKWFATIRAAMVNLTTYRMNFVLQILGPTFFFYFIKYNLWSSIYSDAQSKGQTLIQGMDFQNMMDYHAWILISSLLYKGANSNNLAEDIRLGKISTFLIYPFNFWEYHTAAFFAFEILQIFICAFTLVLMLVGNLMTPPTLMGLFWGTSFSFLAGFLWFLFQYSTGLMAFWLEETWMFRVMFEIIAQFLSGAIVPLEMYPLWAQKILIYTPFPYLTYYPAKAFMGPLPNASFSLMVILAWLGILFLFNQFLWKRGLRLYSGAGM